METPVTDTTKLREMLAKATPGPWRVKTDGNIGNQIEAQSGKKLWDGDTGMRSVCGYQYCGPSERYGDQVEGAAANGELIVAAVNALPALLAKSDRADALEARIRELVAKWHATAERTGVRQFTGNDHALFANELAALLPADGEG